MNLPCGTMGTCRAGPWMLGQFDPGLGSFRSSHAGQTPHWMVPDRIGQARTRPSKPENPFRNQQVDARDEKPIAAMPASPRKGVGGIAAIFRVSEFATRTSARRHAGHPQGCRPLRRPDGGRHENSRTRSAGLLRFHTYPRPRRDASCRIRQTQGFRSGHHRTNSRHFG